MTNSAAFPRSWHPQVKTYSTFRVLWVDLGPWRAAWCWTRTRRLLKNVFFIKCWRYHD